MECGHEIGVDLKYYMDSGRELRQLGAFWTWPDTPQEVLEEYVAHEPFFDHVAGMLNGIAVGIHAYQCDALPSGGSRL